MKRHRDPKWLDQRYWGEQMPVQQMAELAGVSDTTILYWMRKFDIPRSKPGPVRKIWGDIIRPANWQKPWTSREDEIIRTKIRLVSTEIVAKELGRTMGAVQARSRQLGMYLGSGTRFRADIGRINEVLPTEWAWVAGFFDGDGCASIVQYKRREKTYHRPTISFTQKQEMILHWLEAMFGAGSVIHRTKSFGANTYTVNGIIPIYAMLQGMLPYLRVRNHRAQEVITFVEEHYPQIRKIVDLDRRNCGKETCQIQA